VPPPGPLPIEERRHGGQSRVTAGEQVGRRRADLLGRAPGLAGEVHDPRKPLRDQVVAGAVGPLAGEPETGERDVDQVLPRALEGRVVGAELGLEARQLVEDHDVRLRDQLQQQRMTLGACVVERQAPLVAVDRKEPEGLAVQERRAPVAGIVAYARALDLDHLRPEVA
jgi:hypothetical protein